MPPSPEQPRLSSSSSFSSSSYHDSNSHPPSRPIQFLSRTIDILQHICLNLAGISLILVCLPPALVIALGNEDVRRSPWSGHFAHLSWVATEYLGRLEGRHLSTYLLGLDSHQPQASTPTPTSDERRDSAVFFA